MNAVLTPPVTWTTGHTTAVKTGTWRSALARHIHAPSPCHAACPVSGDIAAWIGQARAGDLRAAWQTLSLHNPFPATIGRICHHPCEGACNRAGQDEAVSICKLERHVGDVALEQGWSYPPAPVQHTERVAVVGAGPSGLSAAYQLRRRGYAVTMFESQVELGGLMRYGIPPYRLSRQVLDGEVARLLALGIDVHRGQPLDTPQALAALRLDFDAVYLAYGARRQKRLAQLDYSRPWVVDGADYLARANAGTPPALGHRVVVVGGGSAALDVARSARRAGHSVTILALEAEREMPAQREEIIEAQEEGITIVAGTMLRAAGEAGEGAALRLDCVGVHFKPGAARGTHTLTPIQGSEFSLEADAIVSAIGQDPDLAPLAGACETDPDAALLKADAAGATSADGIWAGGDLTSTARFVSSAIGMGERAALAIDRRLRQRALAEGGAAGVAQGAASESDWPQVPLSAINLHYHPGSSRASEHRQAVPARLADGGEVQLGLSNEQALAEAQRCFSCGTCTHCDNCVTYCPDFAVQPFAGGYTVLTDYCKGCGLCVKECPTGSMTMQEEMR